MAPTMKTTKPTKEFRDSYARVYSDALTMTNSLLDDVIAEIAEEGISAEVWSVLKQWTSDAQRIEETLEDLWAQEF